MKSRLSRLALVAVVAVAALTGCGSQNAGLPIDSTRLSAYVATYTADDPNGGSLQVSLSQNTAGNWVVTSDLQAPTGAMQSQVNLRADLTPDSSEVTLDAGGSQYRIHSCYQEKRLLMEAETPSGPQSAERNLTRPYYDNEQLLVMLPVLNLQAGKRQQFVLIATQRATKLTPTVYLATDADGKALVETVVTPLGEQECQVIKFNAGGAGQPEQTFWVTTSSPFIVAKINNGAINYALTELK